MDVSVMSEYPHQFKNTALVLLLLMLMSALLELPVPLSCACPTHHHTEQRKQKDEASPNYAAATPGKASATVNDKENPWSFTSIYMNMYHVYLIMYAILTYLPIFVWKSCSQHKVFFTVKMAEVAAEMEGGQCRKSLIQVIADRVKSVDPNLQQHFSVLQLSKILSAMIPLLIPLAYLDISTCLFYVPSQNAESLIEKMMCLTGDNTDLKPIACPSGMSPCFRMMTPALLVWMGYLVLKETYVLYTAARMLSPEYQENYYQSLLSNSGMDNALNRSRKVREVLTDNGFLVLIHLPISVRRDVVEVLPKQD